MSDRLVDGRSFRILTAVDQSSRECLLLEADTSDEWNKGRQLVRVFQSTAAFAEGEPPLGWKQR
jgi:hypothetical protein